MWSVSWLKCALITLFHLIYEGLCVAQKAPMQLKQAVASIDAL